MAIVDAAGGSATLLTSRSPARRGFCATARTQQITKTKLAKKVFISLQVTMNRTSQEEGLAPAATGLQACV
ncbi:MAG TPA: hypothetical protein VFI71_10515, partial [Pyrinomonadaceae bacterium]|nr:hypothetical protein [Pyrinomonadaceae bacterium]